MIQKKYLCKNIEEAKKAVSQIMEVLAETTHKTALITFYETGLPGGEVESLLSLIKNGGHPEVKVAGISATICAELLPDFTGIIFNLILSDESDFDVLTIPCVPGEESKAAEILKAKLDSDKNAKAVELFVSNTELNTTRFMENALEGHNDIVLFGTSNIRNINKRITMDDEENSMDVEQVNQEMLNDELAAGDGIIRDGFVAVVFSGEKLKVKANYALGWKPIGRELPVELGTNPAKGETVVTSILSMPAVDIYREYLGVYPNSFFISNICEFPLVVEREGINICLIPIEYGKNGELYFMMTVRPGESLRFSFASHDEVLDASRESIESMEQFAPEALFLTLCGNRINFLKEDAHLEWDGFTNMAPDFALMHGGCELYYHNGKGGILNSAHLAIGFRESDVADIKVKENRPTVESLRQDRTLSLSDRMSTFLGKITGELVDMAGQAESASNAKSAFLSHMSHEIRTPINAILGMDEMILKEAKEDEILGYADVIRSSGNNLLDIVNDILDLSQIEAGKMNILPVEYEMIAAIRDMYNMVRLRAEIKGLSVILDIDENIPSEMFGDVRRAKQVVMNLLTNAVKYTETGKVILSIKKISEGDVSELPENLSKGNNCTGSVRIQVSVKDTGIGLKPEDKEKLFDEYSRFDEKKNAGVEGTGLGMSITRELLELMGSRLKVESTYGEGSEFGFEFIQGIIDNTPLGDITSKLNDTEIKKKVSRFTAEAARILVVDDNEMNLNIVSKLLKDTKMTVDAAKSGEEAIQAVCRNKYDLILLDHLMREMDGPETLKKMKETVGNLSVDAPVISLTANAGAGAREEYLKMGYNDYLSKPVRPNELEDMLYNYLPPEKIRTVNGSTEDI